MAAASNMATSSSTPAQVPTVSEWGLLSEKPYARPRSSRSETAPAVPSHPRQPRQPSPLRTRPRSASPQSSLPPPSPSSELVRPMIAYLPPSMPTQSLDAAMFHDMRAAHKGSAPRRSSPLAKGVYTIYEAPITPPESPEPSIADAIEQEAEEKANAKGALAKRLKLLGRGHSTASLPTASSSKQPVESRKSNSAPPSLRRRTSANSLATTASARPGPPQEAKWLTEVAAPTFSRYQMGPNVVLPKPATESRRVSVVLEEAKPAPLPKARKVEPEAQHEKKPKEHAHVNIGASLKPVASLAAHLPLKKRSSLFFGKAGKQTAVAAA